MNLDFFLIFTCGRQASVRLWHLDSSKRRQCLVQFFKWFCRLEVDGIMVSSSTTPCRARPALHVAPEANAVHLSASFPAQSDTGSLSGCCALGAPLRMKWARVRRHWLGSWLPWGPHRAGTMLRLSVSGGCFMPGAFYPRWLKSWWQSSQLKKRIAEDLFPISWI